MRIITRLAEISFSRRLLRYSLFSSATFALDLLLLFLLTELGGLNYLLSASIAFLVAITGNYMLSRRFVFFGTTRGIWTGYAYFLLIALVGLGIITAGLYFMVEKLGIHYLTARIAIALLAGMWNFSMNVLVNFRDVRDKKLQ
jgi:putative flippase GtrA